MSVFTLAISFLTTSNLPLIHGPNIPGSYAILLFTASEFTSITSLGLGHLPYDLAIPLLGIYPEKTTILKGTCTPVLTVAIFTIARTENQPRCPSADDWIKKLWYIYIYNEILLSHEKEQI